MRASTVGLVIASVILAVWSLGGFAAIIVGAVTGSVVVVGAGIVMLAILVFFLARSA